MSSTPNILPQRPETDNIRALAAKNRERFTGTTNPVFVLQHSPVVGLEHVYLNGALLDPGGSTKVYTIVGRTLTLNTPPNSSDVLIVHYQYSPSASN